MKFFLKLEALSQAWDKNESLSTCDGLIRLKRHKRLNLIIQFQGGAVFSGFGELALLHALAHVPDEIKPLQPNKLLFEDC